VSDEQDKILGAVYLLCDPQRLCHNYRARARGQFGHENCVILRESAIRRFLENAVNALIPQDLNGNRATLRSS
jgi:hypothetical protein